jgi:hypothetical protein
MFKVLAKLAFFEKTTSEPNQLEKKLRQQFLTFSPTFFMA